MTARTAIITGGAGGLGLAMARGLLSDGHRVALIDIDGAATERARKALRGAGAESLGDHDPVFRITAVDGGIRIHDVVADKEMITEVKWTPRGKSLNGGGFRVFGGYIVVLSMSYGSSASSSGSPGAITLDELGLYLPVPAQGSLVVTKNGATYYDME